MRKTKIWIDIITPSEVLFFNSLISSLSADFLITIAKHAENVHLSKILHMKGMSVGCHPAEKGMLKYIGVLKRIFSLLRQLNYFDVAFTFQNPYPVFLSKIMRKKVINFADNDSAWILFNREIGELTFKHSDYLICPKAIPIDNLIRLGADKDHIIQFNGYKEDIYVADYTPDPNFRQKIPFREFIVIRPEALFAVYLREKGTIVPQLLKILSKENINIVFLPRNERERSYAKNLSVYIPQKPINGLDLCWYSHVVLTGSGSLAREAACLGVHAVSFYPGKLLSVDKQLIKEGKIFHSRDPYEIAEYVSLHYGKRKRSKINTEKSKKVKMEVIKILEEVLETIKT